MLKSSKKIHQLLTTPELEVILHPSMRRLRITGAFSFLGQLIFWWLWTYILPQPYEDWRVRIVVACTALGLVFWHKDSAYHSSAMHKYFSLTCWLQFPLFFTWMYLMNSNSSMWMASVAVMIVMYYQLTDWRLASIGLITGSLLAIFVAIQIRGNIEPIPSEHSVVFFFSWGCALLFALSSANIRRERLRHALTVIGIMAHELRTPLATMALIAQAIRAEATAIDAQHAQRLGELAARMDALTRTINHHIDLQMANARYTKQHNATQLLSARQLVSNVLNDYPFGSKRERQCVEVILHSDFWFHGSSHQFIQVLNNLIKNALHSLKAAQSRYDHGDLRIELGMRDAIGRIQITDRGIGINANQINLIFEPFFSTANETGHGLGLAFCKQVVEAAYGKIMVHSETALGATFTLQLPCQPSPTEQVSPDHEVSPLSPT
jgi:two-component system, CAI-1 autoinducer sensor kinase/phosphatase CqsS